jgi:hypothetical protein
VSLRINNKGNARILTNNTIIFELKATSISPTFGFTGGGNLIKIYGSGFNHNNLVSVGKNDCPVVNVTYSMISCVVPANVRFQIFIFLI